MSVSARRIFIVAALAWVALAGPSPADQGAVQGEIKYYPSYGLITMDMQATGLFQTPDGKPGLRGEYFNNRKLKGEPVMVRVDPEIQFHWRGHGGTPPDERFGEDVSVRWSGVFGPAPATGNYQFNIFSGDAVRVWLGGEPAIDNWRPHMPRTDTASARLEKGDSLEVRIDLSERGGNTFCRFGWDFLNVYWEEFFGVSRNHPETGIFRDEWDGGFGKVVFRPAGRSYVDFQCWYGAEFIRRGIGLYYDNTFPKAAWNPGTTTAYRHADGTIHPTARMWWHRDYLRRIWTLHQQMAPAEARRGVDGAAVYLERKNK